MLDGWIALSTTLKDGKRRIIGFASHGDLLGFQTEAGAAISYSAESVTPCRVCSVPQRLLEEVCQHDPEAVREIIRLLANRTAHLLDHLVNVTSREARERIAHLLVVLFRQSHGRFPSGQREILELPLTQVQIGQAVALTDVHVSRIFKLLHKQNIVRRTRDRLEILDPAKLMDAGGFDRDSASEY